PSRPAKPAGYPNGKSKPRTARSPRAAIFVRMSDRSSAAAWRGGGFSQRSPPGPRWQIQMLSRPVFGWFAALQSTITYCSNRGGPLISVVLVGVAVAVVMADAGAADMVVMALLRRAGGVLVADDAG